MQAFLNLGCGRRFHKDWVNINFVSTGPGVTAHDLAKGIPFDAESFDVVYHSHVLEHFSKEDGEKFIRECARVLKPGGTIRIAVPNLEEIVRIYLQNLEGALEGSSDAAKKYEWIMLELYDQSVRSRKGGEMSKYLSRPLVENEEFVFSRMGEEGRRIRNKFLTGKKPQKDKKDKTLLQEFKSALIKAKRLVFNRESALEKSYKALGKFRMRGEIHQWMYDRYSLSQLLRNASFSAIKVTTAFDSTIPGWNAFELDSKDGIVFKPDSLFMEAKK